eukprot:1479180-Rhodomonas_salina.1
MLLRGASPVNTLARCMSSFARDATCGHWLGNAFPSLGSVWRRGCRVTSHHASGAVHHGWGRGEKERRYGGVGVESALRQRVVSAAHHALRVALRRSTRRGIARSMEYRQAEDDFDRHAVAGPARVRAAGTIRAAPRHRAQAGRERRIKEGHDFDAN